MKSGYVYNKTTGTYQLTTAGFNRFCSADLPALSAFYNAETGNGYNGRIYMNGEEAGAEGRAFAHFLDGNSYELPYLGRFSWENSVANPGTGDKTVVVGTDDSTPGQIYVYVGTKSTSSDRIAAAGLSGGTLYGVKIPTIPIESDATNPVGPVPFTLVSLGDVSSKTGATLEVESNAQLVTRFARPEDAAWDPRNPNDLYVAMTANFTGLSRLWRLRFTDAAQPQLGGTAEILLDSTSGPRMMDNLTVSDRGSVFIQEDIGGQSALGKIWRYSIANDTVEEVARHDAARFTAGSPNFLTIDEESSGIIPVPEILGEGWYLINVQAHYGLGGELVEGGQIMAVHFPPGREK
jgi:hypothetical protein